MHEQVFINQPTPHNMPPLKTSTSAHRYSPYLAVIFVISALTLLTACANTGQSPFAKTGKAEIAAAHNNKPAADNPLTDTTAQTGAMDPFFTSQAEMGSGSASIAGLITPTSLTDALPTAEEMEPVPVTPEIANGFSFGDKADSEGNEGVAYSQQAGEEFVVLDIHASTLLSETADQQASLSSQQVLISGHLHNQQPGADMTPLQTVSEFGQQLDAEQQLAEKPGAAGEILTRETYPETASALALLHTDAITQAASTASAALPIVAKQDKPRDLWQRIRQGFRLNNHDNPRIRPHLDWYARNQAYLDRVVERARPFLYEIVEEVARNDIPMEIALLPVVESAFQPFAYSPGRAAGIWQFIPGTGRRYGLKQNWWYDGRRDVPAATRAAIRYLKVLQKHFDGDWLLALAAYNSGEGRVLNAVRKNRKKGKGTDFWSLDLPNETRDYVPKLLAISAIVDDTQKHGIALASIPDQPYLEHVDIGSQIDLALAAELAGMPIEDIYRINPAFNRWATDPKGPHVLSLPREKAQAFRTALTQVKNRIQWQRHRIRQGESLGSIAKKYQTTVKLLQQVNNIRDKWIRAGSNIVIPVATRNLQQYLSADQRKLAIQHAPRNGKKIQYTVRKGDTLWDISRKHKVSVEQLASWNAMAPRDSLMPGQNLIIWISSGKPVAVRNRAEPPSEHTRQRLQYRVRKGDSLALIARKFRVTINNLRNWNSLPKGKYLQPGQRLTLYIDVTRQS